MPSVGSSFTIVNESIEASWIFANEIGTCSQPPLVGSTFALVNESIEECWIFTNEIGTSSQPQRIRNIQLSKPLATLQLDPRAIADVIQLWYQNVSSASVHS